MTRLEEQLALAKRWHLYWFRKSLDLERALHQAYLDGGCREDEAKEMVDAVMERL